jgi:hypothetical protein
MKKLSNNSLPDSSFLSNIVVVENQISVDSKTIVHFTIRLPADQNANIALRRPKKENNIGCACCDVPCFALWHGNQS